MLKKYPVTCSKYFLWALTSRCDGVRVGGVHLNSLDFDFKNLQTYNNTGPITLVTSFCTQKLCNFYMNEFSIRVQSSVEVLCELFHNTIKPLTRRQCLYCSVDYSRSSWSSTRRQMYPGGWRSSLWFAPLQKSCGRPCQGVRDQDICWVHLYLCCTCKVSSPTVCGTQMRPKGRKSLKR